MSYTPQQTTATRAPDCVTETRKGNTVLTVSGFFRLDATETAADKMAKVIAAEAATGSHLADMRTAPTG